MAYYISLGPNCHAAGNLRNLQLRKFSTPFDWLLTDENKGISYVNDNINTSFEKFTTDLEYNKRDKVISKNYPYAEFFHFNIIKEKSVEDTLKKRAKRFMELISNPDNYIVFLYYYQQHLFNKKSKFDDFFQTLKTFEKNENIKAKFRLVVYVSNDDSDFEMNMHPEIAELEKTSFIKYIRDTKASKYYGKLSDFKDLIDRINSSIPKDELDSIKQIEPPKEQPKKDSPKEIPKINTPRPKTPKDQSEFYIKPIGGLCTRIRVLFSYLSKTRLDNKKLVVVWDKDQDCNGYFLDYFQPIKDVVFIVNTKEKIDYEGSYPIKSIERKLYIKNLKELKLNDKIKKEVDKFLNRNLTKPFCAIHVRRTDLTKKVIDEGKFTSDIKFEEFVKSNNDKHIIYIATDNPDSQKYFIKLKNTIYNKPIRELKSKRATSIEDALIDLYVCVKAKSFKGTVGSSFTELIEILRDQK